MEDKLRHPNLRWISTGSSFPPSNTPIYHIPTARINQFSAAMYVGISIGLLWVLWWLSPYGRRFRHYIAEKDRQAIAREKANKAILTVAQQAAKSLANLTAEKGKSTETQAPLTPPAASNNDGPKSE